MKFSCSYLLKTLLFSFVISTPTLASATVYQCSIDGKTIFQSTPCVKGEQKTLMQEKPVHGMHGSWFTRPKFSLELRCNEKGCSCDKERHRYPVGSYSKINRLNQAMDILQSAWAEDDYLLSQYTGEMKARGKAPEELTRELKLNGCEIKYAQHTLKTYFGEVSTKIYNERENIQARINKGDKECVEPAPIDWENAPNEGIFEQHRYENESRSYQMCMMENEVARRDNEFQKELNEEHYRELKRNLATLERPRIKQR